MTIKEEKKRRKEWHKFYITNKHRFTDSEVLAELDPNLIYVPKTSSGYRNWPSKSDDEENIGLIKFED